MKKTKKTKLLALAGLVASTAIIATPFIVLEVNKTKKIDPETGINNQPVSIKFLPALSTNTGAINKAQILAKDLQNSLVLNNSSSTKNLTDAISEGKRFFWNKEKQAVYFANKELLVNELNDNNIVLSINSEKTSLLTDEIDLANHFLPIIDVDGVKQINHEIKAKITDDNNITFLFKVAVLDGNGEYNFSKTSVSNVIEAQNLVSQLPSDIKATSPLLSEENRSAESVLVKKTQIREVSKKDLKKAALDTQKYTQEFEKILTDANEKLKLALNNPTILNKVFAEGISLYFNTTNRTVFWSPNDQYFASNSNAPMFTLDSAISDKLILVNDEAPVSSFNLPNVKLNYSIDTETETITIKYKEAYVYKTLQTPLVSQKTYQTSIQIPGLVHEKTPLTEEQIFKQSEAWTNFVNWYSNTENFNLQINDPDNKLESRLKQKRHLLFNDSNNTISWSTKLNPTEQTREKNKTFSFVTPLLDNVVLRNANDENSDLMDYTYDQETRKLVLKFYPYIKDGDKKYKAELEQPIEASVVLPQVHEEPVTPPSQQDFKQSQEWNDFKTWYQNLENFKVKVQDKDKKLETRLTKGNLFFNDSKDTSGKNSISWSTSVSPSQATRTKNKSFVFETTFPENTVLRNPNDETKDSLTFSYDKSNKTVSITFYPYISHENKLYKAELEQPITIQVNLEQQEQPNTDNNTENPTPPTHNDTDNQGSNTENPDANNPQPAPNPEQQFKASETWRNFVSWYSNKDNFKTEITNQEKLTSAIKRKYHFFLNAASNTIAWSSSKTPKQTTLDKNNVVNLLTALPENVLIKNDSDTDNKWLNTEYNDETKELTILFHAYIQNEGTEYKDESQEPLRIKISLPIDTNEFDTWAVGATNGFQVIENKKDFLISELQKEGKLFYNENTQSIFIVGKKDNPNSGTLATDNTVLELKTKLDPADDRYLVVNGGAKQYTKKTNKETGEVTYSPNKFITYEYDQQAAKLTIHYTTMLMLPGDREPKVSEQKTTYEINLTSSSETPASDTNTTQPSNEGNENQNIEINTFDDFKNSLKINALKLKDGKLDALKKAIKDNKLDLYYYYRSGTIVNKTGKKFDTRNTIFELVNKPTNTSYQLASPDSEQGTTEANRKLETEVANNVLTIKFKALEYKGKQGPHNVSDEVYTFTFNLGQDSSNTEDNDSSSGSSTAPETETPLNEQAYETWARSLTSEDFTLTSDTEKLNQAKELLAKEKGTSIHYDPDAQTLYFTEGDKPTAKKAEKANVLLSLKPEKQNQSGYVLANDSRPINGKKKKVPNYYLSSTYDAANSQLTVSFKALSSESNPEASQNSYSLTFTI
ncbi:hypothetical protein [Mycoplasma sp. 3341]|uniref:hypothetical protein n=1 Tax=Mycoplasma sp. 3341 TaxID=3447506 RepID=UPI003F65F31D